MSSITARRETFLLFVLTAFLSLNLVCRAAEPKKCGENGPEVLKPYGNIKDDFMTDLLVVGQCDVTTDPNQQGPLVYAFHNVNIVSNGKLIFHDDYDIDFYAESILVENGGKLAAVSTQSGFLPNLSKLATVLPFQKRLTFHLWGKEADAGIECKTVPDPNFGPCGIPKDLWDANTTMADHLMMDKPMPPSLPKNQKCKSYKGYSQFLPGDDCFYRYEIQDSKDKKTARQAYFGHKVLAVSFGGSLQLFGSRGVTYLKQNEKCTPNEPNSECNPAFSGTSWVRLTGVADATHITVSRALDWKKGDHIVVTGTDYLPSHSEVAVLAQDAGGTASLTLEKPGIETTKYYHRFTTYKLSDKSVPADVGPQNDPWLPDLNREVDTRAAVALLNRNIQVVSEGDEPWMPFTEKPDNFYGGHTMVRQGFLSYQVQGVEFYQLGQGGAKGRYPVHFHMLRKTAQPASTMDDSTPEPLNYLKDCSIWDSMTRWVTLHATEGMYLARNVGFKSIGHGYYLEDATEVNNKLYSNIGILARAAIMDTVHNPRQVPGILADNQAVGGPQNMDYMPYRSDYNHPSVFWITNGWNDFQYNFAAGAATCGACYWWIGTGVSGPSQYQTWDGYASQQIQTDSPINWYRAGLTPLKSFTGNSCVAAMSSFQMNGQTGECLGMTPSGTAGLAAVESSAPPGPVDYKGGQPFQIYYPVITDLHNPTLCVPDKETNSCAAPATGRAPCDGGDYYGTCTVTQLDHYTTSFNYAQTNFAAVWLRKGWDLFTNGAVTDVQTGGLNFITGGGYTRSDVNLGEWLLARNTVLIGHTQNSETDPNGKANPFASPLGPFNHDSKLACDNKSSESRAYCAYANGGVTFNLPILPGQKLLNIYDGPSHQESNAYLDINVSTPDNCSQNSGGTCFSSNDPLAWNFGVLQDRKKASCYIPNAAIAWKQPNGFYYPPAFHSRNLYFRNVDIRHFVVDPLFKEIKPEDYDPFQQNQQQVEDRYCTYTSNMFSANFNHIDRQTVLNDDDGSLTGLLGGMKDVTGTRPSLSINEDPFFNTPLTTPECLSDINVKPLYEGKDFTATTSPYEWLSTAMIAKCAINNKQCVDLEDADLTIRWGSDCGNSFCRGVPLYREYLTAKEFDDQSRPQIRMMGQLGGQRSTLSLNHGRYYIDTTQGCTSQGACPKCEQHNLRDPKICDRYENDWRPSIFVKKETYYVYFIYATENTKQKYDIYFPKSSEGEADVNGITLDPTNAYSVKDVSGIATAIYKDPILTVTVDLSSTKSAFTNSKASFCRPKSYCKPSGDACVCQDSSKCRDSDCAWGPSDIDCPADPNNPNLQLCFGFRFTMPANYQTPDKPLPPPDDLFVKYTEQKDTSYFSDSKFAFGKASYANDDCKYASLPSQ
jgi:hypothetical protein